MFFLHDLKRLLRGIPAVEYTDAGYIILEQDYTKHTEMESVKISLENLKKYKNVVY